MNDIKVNLNDCDYYNKRLDSEIGLMTKSSKYWSEKLNIITIGDLLDKTNDSKKFRELFPSTEKGSRAYTEVMSICKLLKCKYQNVDPKIDFKKEDKAEYFRQFGFSTQLVNCLIRSRYDHKNFMNLLYADNFKDTVKRIPNFGKKLYIEMVYKSSIILFYYKNKFDNNVHENHDGHTIYEFDLACTGIEMALKSKALSTDECESIEGIIARLNNLITEYKEMNIAKALPEFANQYVKKSNQKD